MYIYTKNVITYTVYLMEVKLRRIDTRWSRRRLIVSYEGNDNSEGGVGLSRMVCRVWNTLYNKDDRLVKSQGFKRSAKDRREIAKGSAHVVFCSRGLGLHWTARDHVPRETKKERSRKSERSAASFEKLFGHPSYIYNTHAGVRVHEEDTKIILCAYHIS